ncbi:MAG: hypothetical protein KIT16_04450 [Rhodospirillaceae bacterium]|nr:hypothetical protein [Rhodospirillaceae bacterium]
MQPLSRRFALVLLSCSALVAPLSAAHAAKNTAALEDQAVRDPALVRVRAAMIAAAKAQDFARLAPHVDAKIHLDFGGGAGMATFRKRMAKGSPLWAELIWVLEHGGRFEKDGTFMAPYTFSSETGNLDPFEAAVIVAPTVARTEPRATADVVAQLKDTVVKVVDWRRNDATPSPFYRRKDWVAIELAGKRKAWVEARFVRSVADYRAGLRKVGGNWKMTVFIAGD